MTVFLGKLLSGWEITIQKELVSRNVRLDVDGLVSSGLAYMCRKFGARVQS